MIQIKRCECPDVLVDSPLEGTLYNKKPVVDALFGMQKEKCCYCEQFISNEGHIKAVEHFHPKSIYKHQENDWKNLLLACAQCNGKKSDKFPVRLSDKDEEVSVLYKHKVPESEALLIDPSDSKCDPEDHIDFIVDDKYDDSMWGLPRSKEGSEKGRISIEVIGLDSSYHLRKRQTILEDLRFFHIDLYESNKHNNAAKFESVKNKIEVLMSSNSQYSACVRAYVRLKRLDEKYGLKIPKGYE